MEQKEEILRQPLIGKYSINVGFGEAGRLSHWFLAIWQSLITCKRASEKFGDFSKDEGGELGGVGWGLFKR